MAWVRPADIWFITGDDFPYHFTVEGLAQLASNLIAEQGDPWGMARILGDDYWVDTVAAPHGLLHQVSRNGNHRTVAIKAAGFPVALVHIDALRRSVGVVAAGLAESDGTSSCVCCFARDC